jgi:hypothetical protein
MRVSGVDAALVSRAINAKCPPDELSALRQLRGDRAFGPASTCEGLSDNALVKPLGSYIPGQAAMIVFAVTLFWFARATRYVQR